MTVQEFLKSAKQVRELADKYLGKYEEFYSLNRLDIGNIEFKVPELKEEELLSVLPDDTKDFNIYMQFCFYNGKWNLCMSLTIRNVGEYKKHRRKKNG